MQGKRGTDRSAPEPREIIEYSFDRLLAEGYNVIGALRLDVEDDASALESKQALRRIRARRIRTVTTYRAATV